MTRAARAGYRCGADRWTAAAPHGTDPRVVHDDPDASAAGVPAVELRVFADRLRAAGYTADRLKDLLRMAYPDDVGPLTRAHTL